MACQTRQAFLPSSRCEQVRNFPSFYSWLRSCGSLWSSAQDVLEAFEWSLSSAEEEDSFVKGTSYTSSWKPGTRLSAIQRSLPLPWCLSCCGWQCTRSAFALQSIGETCLLTLATGTVCCGCCICSSTCTLVSRFAFTSRAPTFRWHRIHGLRRSCLAPVRTWLDLTCNLNLAEYFIRF